MGLFFIKCKILLLFQVLVNDFCKEINFLCCFSVVYLIHKLSMQLFGYYYIYFICNYK